jgi:autotransporter-associated beta strand protein
LNDGSLIDANLGQGSATSNGDVRLNGTTAASLVSVETGNLDLGSAHRLASTLHLSIEKDATVKLGGNELIGELTGAGSIVLSAHTLSAASGNYGGAMSGTGGLTKHGAGTLVVSGINHYTGTTAVQQGTLTLDGSIESTAVMISSGATLHNMKGGFSSAAALNNAGRLTLGNNDTVASLVNSGSIDGTATLTASHYALNDGSLVNAHLGTGTLTSNGRVALNGTSAASSVGIESGALTLGSAQRLASNANVALASGATLHLGGAEKIGGFVSAGHLTGVTGSVLTSSLYDLRDGAVVDANLGTGTLISNGAVLLNGEAAAEIIQVQTGALTLGGPDRLADYSWVDVTDDALLVLANGSDTIRLLTGGGDIELRDGSVLTVREGAYSGSATSTGALLKDAAPKLILSGDNTYEAGTVVRRGELILANSGTLNSDVVVEQQGTFRVNGLVHGTVKVESGGSMNGNGTIASNVINFGTIAPGNSPGVLSVNGNYAENGMLNIEIDGRAGAGVTGGHDQLKVSGTVAINQGSSLLLTRSAVNGFEPAQGDRFLIINAAGGISGHFSAIDQSDFATKLFFDYGTGYVHGTGVGSGESLHALGGTSANRRVMAGLLLNNARLQGADENPAAFDSRTPGGALFKVLIEAPQLEQTLEALSPSPYAGLIEYSLRATRNHSRANGRTPAFRSADGWQISTGFTQYRAAVEKGESETDYALRSEGVSAAVSRRVGSRVELGGFFGNDEGTVSARRLAYDVSGYITGLYGTLLRTSSGRFSANVGATYGAYDYEGSRSSMLSVVTGTTQARSYDFSAGAEYTFVRSRGLSVSAISEVAYTMAYIDGFMEKTGSDGFRIHGLKDTSLIGEAGLQASIELTNRLSLSGRMTYAHNFQDARREVFASLGGAGSRVRVTAPGLDENATEAGVTLRYALSEKLAAAAYYDRSIENRSGGKSAFGVRVNLTF